MVIPRALTKRLTAISTGTSTTMTPHKPSRGFSKSNGISSTTTLLVLLCSSMRLFISLPMAGCTIPLRVFKASALPNTLSATACRFSEPSSLQISSPKASAMRRKTSVPGCCNSRATASASTMIAPCSDNICDTVDLPEPIPPVRPTSIMLLKNYSAGAAGVSSTAAATSATASAPSAAGGASPSPYSL